MLFFGRKKREAQKQRNEAEIEAIRKKASLRAQEAAEELAIFNEYVDEARKSNDITIKLYLAMNGKRRQ